MKMPSAHLLERLAETLIKDLFRLPRVGAKVAGMVAEDTGKLAKLARYRLRDGSDFLGELEKKVTSNFKTRPLAYLLVTLGLAVIVGLKITLDRQSRSADEE